MFLKLFKSSMIIKCFPNRLDPCWSKLNYPTDIYLYVEIFVVVHIYVVCIWVAINQKFSSKFLLIFVECIISQLLFPGGEHNPQLCNQVLKILNTLLHFWFEVNFLNSTMEKTNENMLFPQHSRNQFWILTRGSKKNWTRGI